MENFRAVFDYTLKLPVITISHKIHVILTKELKAIQVEFSWQVIICLAGILVDNIG